MIGVLEIKNFKSIRSLRLDCKRLNVFIGEPNAGKSNILESLGMLSYAYFGQFGTSSKDFVRYDSIGNLFYDQALDHAIEIAWDANSFTLRFQDGRFKGESKQARARLEGGHPEFHTVKKPNEVLAPFKYYKFRVSGQFERPESDFLLPPFGDNLVTLLLTHKDLRSLANDLFSPVGLRLGIRPQEGKIEVIKDYEDVIVSYPYETLSDTLQRLIFHMSAILSNKESVLVFEEPESHTFPYYTKYLAETMALDENDNQYFIATHNPYFLMPLVEKAAKDEIAVFVTYYRDYQTKVKALNLEDLERLMELDVFSNIEMFLENE